MKTLKQIVRASTTCGVLLSLSSAGLADEPRCLGDACQVYHTALQAENVDHSWATSAESTLRDRVERDGVVELSVTCKSSLCHVQFRASDEVVDVLSQEEHALFRSFKQVYVAGRQGDAGQVFIDIYLSRDGFNLPSRAQK